MRKILPYIFIFFTVLNGKAQELNAKVTVISNRVGNSVPKNTFITLQTALTNFLNNRKWSNENYAAAEKIDCNFLLNLEQGDDANVYKAKLTVQAARPVFNSSYISPIINYQDDNILFRYAEFQQLEFNESRVTGSDPLISNLTAVIAYYAHIIIAFDNASFGLHGGDAQFQKAQNIINNAPDGRGITGWKAFDGVRNRYWLVENMLNNRYNVFHDIYYNYYRNVLDKLYDDNRIARTEMINVLNQLNSFNADNPNTMINQFFFQGKSTELIKIFSKATPPEKTAVLNILPRIDITNATKYKDELK